MSRKLAVIAIGGNSLIKHRDKQSVEDQYLALCETMEHIADVIQQGWQVLITHGNGPQVGFIMLRSEIARAVAGMHIVLGSGIYYIHDMGVFQLFACQILVPAHIRPFFRLV